MKKHRQFILSGAIALTFTGAAHAQFQGPSTGSTPYVLPTQSNFKTTSILTVDNTGANPDDSVGGYGMAGIPDGLGAFDNGNGTFTVLMNHELGSTAGVARAHGGIGAFVSKWVIDKNTFAVTSGSDLMTSVYGWNTTLQQSNAAPTAGVAFNRFCSADLPAVGAFSFGALGTTERIFMHGEEGGAAGWQQATVVTGADAGKSYTLGKLNIGTDGSGRTGVGAWENALANPTPQLKTVVIGNNDGGTGIMNNSVAVYVGTKTNTGSEIDKAGLTNGVTKFINIQLNPTEIVNATTRATNITSGTPFTLSLTSSTTFSRPEDGAWNPLNLSQFYFVTTDQRDTTELTGGTTIGRSRLWRLNFSDISNPDLGGTIDLLLDGTEGQNMFDNLTVNEQTGRVILQEDVGGAARNGKIWEYDPAFDSLSLIAKHDPARFGDIAGGVASPTATAPFNNDEEASGIIDITSIMAGSALNTGLPGEAWYLSTDQAHYSLGGSQVEGGQLFALHQVPEPTTGATLVGGLGMLLGLRRRRS